MKSTFSTSLGAGLRNGDRRGRDYGEHNVHERSAPWAHRPGYRWLDRAAFASPHHPVLGFPKALLNATALVLGYFTTCAAIGVAGLTLFGGAGGAVSMVGRAISVSVGGLLIVLALRSLLNAPDPDAQPPRWMESISSMSPARAFGFGIALFPIQIKNLAIFVACLNLIAAASLGPQGSAVALGLVLVIFAIPVVVLIGLYAVMPNRASDMLGSLRAWMEKNNRAITVVLCFAFGAFFIVRGLSGQERR